MFTLHPLFTTYHSEIKGENRKVNSVNSSFEKKFFMWIKDALVWIRATDPNLLIKNDLTFRFIDGLKIDWSEKQWGHKRGHISLLCFISVVYSQFQISGVYSGAKEVCDENFATMPLNATNIGLSISCLL